MEYIRNWFSNMELFDEPLVFEGISYASVENFYQAMKTDDVETRQYIASLPPRKSKTEIRKFPIKEAWNIAEKLRIMEFALNHKFTLKSSWGKRLLETEDEDIIEYNNWGDVFWGVDIEEGAGRNELGKLLMKRRNELNLEIVFSEDSQSQT